MSVLASGKKSRRPMSQGPGESFEKLCHGVEIVGLEFRVLLDSVFASSRKAFFKFCAHFGFWA